MDCLRLAVLSFQQILGQLVKGPHENLGQGPRDFFQLPEDSLI